MFVCVLRSVNDCFCQKLYWFFDLDLLLCIENYPRCTSHPPVAMDSWLSARRSRSTKQIVRRNFSPIAAFFLITKNMFIRVGFSLQRFELSGAVTLMKFDTKRQNASRSLKEGVQLCFIR